MRFARKTINSNMLSEIMELPVELQNKKVEILIFPVSEKEKTKKIFNPREFIGLLKLDDPKKDVKEIRSDWERI